MSKKKKNFNNSQIVRIRRIGLIIMTIMGICIANVLFTMITGSHLRSGVNVINYLGGGGQKPTTVYANRGNIYDRDREVIAQDVESFDVYAIIDRNSKQADGKPNYVQNYEATSEKLAPILGCKAKTLMKYFNFAHKNGMYQTEFGSYGKGLDSEQKEEIEKLKIPGIAFVKGTTRSYPTGVFASQLIGYANKNPDTDEVSGTMGLEKYYDEYLKGENGVQAIKKDSSGRYLPDGKKYLKKPIKGDDIYLTLDRNVQIALEKCLQETMDNNRASKAWGIVMNAKTGEILAQAGYPTFDLNKRNNADNYFNLPSEWTYEPGSVMKPFVYAAAMNEGVYDGNALVQSGVANIVSDNKGNLSRAEDGGKGEVVATIHEALGNSYGMISYDDAFVRSLNTQIVSMVTGKLGIDREYKYLKKFGFDHKVGIKGINENPGALADKSQLSQIMTGFGQASTVNAYQLIQAYSAIFGNGKMVKPYLIKKIVDTNNGDVVYQGKTEKSQQIVRPEVAKQVRELMHRVVEEPYGTGHKYKMYDVDLAAKTGTGEIAIKGGYSKTNFTTSICAGAPYDDPQIIFLYTFQSPNYLNFNTDFFKNVIREALIAVNEYHNPEEKEPTNSDGLSSDYIDENNTSFNTYTLPNLINHTTDYVENKLANCNVNKIVIGDGNTIINQYPQGGSKVITNENIFLLTNGEGRYMQNMIGWNRKDVEEYAKLLNIKLQIKGSGVVSAQSILPGEPIDPNATLIVELQ